MPRKVFTAGEILTAANLNDVSDQTVMVFDDATARTTAIPTPVEGMVTYLKDEDEVTVFDGSNFVAVSQPGILQVVQGTLTSAFTASVGVGASTAITGLTATITPTSATSKILVSANVTAGSPTNLHQFYSLTRGGTEIFLGEGSGSRQQRTTGSNASSGAGRGQMSASLTFLDSPATTSALTYGLLVAHSDTGTTTVFVNRAGDDDNFNTRARTASSITVMEVAG